MSETLSPATPETPNPSTTSPDASLTLLDLLNLANKGYPDEWLSNYYDPETGARVEGDGDGLAKFIVIELTETFEPTADRETQLGVARQVMETAIKDLQYVIDVIEEA